MFDIRLQNQKGFNWIKQGNFFAKGFFFEGESLIEGESFARFLESNQEKSLTEVASEIDKNGQFTLIREDSDRLEIITDCVRSFPIFYCIAGNKVNLRDNIEGVAVSEEALLEYQTCGYTTGSQTIYQGWQQLQASEHIVFTMHPHLGIQKRSSKLPTFTRDIKAEYEENSWHKSLAASFDAVSQRLYSLSKKCDLVIPLSGGFDSRLIAAMCKNAGINNVTTYSYGVPGNLESTISEKVAQHLGYKWVFIEYSEKKWNYILKNRELFHYCRSASAVPHVQDMIAAHELQDRGLLNSHSIVVPGHSGDFVGGSHIPHFFRFARMLSRQELIQYIIRKHYNLHPDLLRKNQSHFISAISNQLPNLEKLTLFQAVSCLETWDLAERQSKYIVNSVRGYEWYDSLWYCPLYDRSILDVLQKLRIGDAVDTYLYRMAVKNYCSNFLDSSFSYGNEKRQFLKYTIKYAAHLCHFDKLFKRHQQNKFMKCPIEGDASIPFLGALACWDLKKHFVNYTP